MDEYSLVKNFEIVEFDSPKCMNNKNIDKFAVFCIKKMKY